MKYQLSNIVLCFVAAVIKAQRKRGVPCFSHFVFRVLVFRGSSILAFHVFVQAKIYLYGYHEWKAHFICNTGGEE